MKCLLTSTSDLANLKMWEPLQNLLTSSSSSDGIKRQVLWIIGTAIQNNPAAQNAVSRPTFINTRSCSINIPLVPGIGSHANNPLFLDSQRWLVENKIKSCIRTLWLDETLRPCASPTTRCGWLGRSQSCARRYMIIPTLHQYRFLIAVCVQ